MGLVAENAGIVVGVDETGSTAIDGQGTWSAADARPYILLATDKYTAYRRQMDIPHEIAHLVLHRHVKDEDLERHFSLIERQAWILAGAFLLPHRAFAAEIPSLSLDGFLSLKRRWMVSVGAMIMRAETLETLSPYAAELLWRYRAAKGWHRKEPFDLPERNTGRAALPTQAMRRNDHWRRGPLKKSFAGNGHRARCGRRGDAC